MVVFILLVMTLQTVMLVCALSLDAFVASFAFGTQKIKIPFFSVLLINTICACFLGISVFVGSMVRPYITESFASFISFAILTCIGISKLFDSLIKNKIKKHKIRKTEIDSKELNFNFILSVYADSTIADSDNSRTISAKEAVLLAVALSLDGLAAGVGTGITEVNYVQLMLFSLISDMLAVMFGSKTGKKFAGRFNLDLSWVGGVLLLVLAFTKLF